MKVLRIITGIVFFLIFLPLTAQQDTAYEYWKPNYQSPKKYEVAEIEVKGITYFDPKVVKLFTGLYKGQIISIPGEEITNAVENLWKQKLFTDVQVLASEPEEGKLVLTFVLEEKPRLDAFKIKGLKKGKAKSLREELSLKQGDIVTDNLKIRTANEVKSHYVDKGYLNVQVNITEENPDIVKNAVQLRITVDPGIRTKIAQIVFAGNKNIPDKNLRRTMKSTKQKAIWRFKRSKFIENDYEADKQLLIGYYNSKGFRDAQIVHDSIYNVSENTIGIKIDITEGPKYYFRDIKWVGNTKYRTSYLQDTILAIKRGDIYDQSRLEAKLFMSPNGIDVSSLYMDDGYLFFQITPVEVLIEHDSIDIEVRITEGPQATINKVTVTGNTKTSDYVILRELRTKPGQKFSRSDIQRSIRELATLGYFDPEKLDVVPTPNPAAGTVDIEYKVEERPSDQIELSGGFGYGTVVGTLGLNLTNFSTRKMFKKGQWSPIPSGDGQRVSLRAQSNGTYFQSYNASFTEPWLGGKRANSLSVSLFHSIQNPTGKRIGDANRQSIQISGVTVGLGRLLRWPDDYFSLTTALTYQRYNLNNYPNVFSFSTGISDNVNLRIVLSRNSQDQPIYPRNGSSFTWSLQITPPVSLFRNIDYKTAPDQVKFKFIEYHKWKFDAAWYTTIFDKMVLATQAKFGFMGFYNRDIGAAPFERFYLGGAGLIGFNLDGRELIAFRGYKDNSVTPRSNITGSTIGATIYNKFTAELRYPISLNPQATVYALTFVEGGNSWSRFKEYNPFQLLRSTGGGIRVFLPMFGLLGLDYGYGFDPNPYQSGTNKGQFHFFIGQQF